LPTIRFADLPRPLSQHLLKRVEERRIPLSDLRRLQAWAASGPVAPDGDWFKDFGSFKLYGSGQFPETLLLKSMAPFGKEID
jgi:hypothetical protein